MFKVDVLGRLEKRPVVVSFDSEWTKNYRIRNGNRPFCFSLVILDASRPVTERAKCSIFGRYADDEREIPRLLEEADVVLARALSDYQVRAIVGHQLSSDLAALTSFSPGLPLLALQDLRREWRERRSVGQSRVVDTRYDLNGHLKGPSRRLVDVCHEFSLQVDQPELGNLSMTALQRKFLASRDVSIRERLMVLNIRHSLSCGVVYLLAQGRRRGRPSINVNAMLARNLEGRFDYVSTPQFRGLAS
jgi:hypothetical protein